MKKIDLDRIAALELAIKEKYGDLATRNPASFWNEEKEANYLEESKLEEESSKHEAKIKIGEFFVTKKLFNKSKIKSCPSCGKLLMKTRDDLYLNKYGMCEACFYLHVDGREING